MTNNQQNRECAMMINSALYDLKEQGFTDNAVCNGLLFSLTIHILNAGFEIDEIKKQLDKLFKTVNKEIGKLDENEIVVSSDKPINSSWD